MALKCLKHIMKVTSVELNQAENKASINETIPITQIHADSSETDKLYMNGQSKVIHRWHSAQYRCCNAQNHHQILDILLTIRTTTAQ